MKYTIGKKYKISSKNTSNTSYVRIGEIVTLVENDMSGTPFLVKQKNGNTTWVRDLSTLNGKESALKIPTYVVVWEEDSDPAQFFTSEHDALTFIKELVENQDVREDSIVIAEVKNVRKVSAEKKLNYSQHKI